MGVNYGRLKQALTTAGFPVTAGDTFFAKDFGTFEKFLTQEAYLKGVNVNPAAFAYGLSYGTLLPQAIAAQFSTGIQLDNVLLWEGALKAGTQEMIAGTHNPGTNFVVGNGNNIQVGISLRYPQDGVGPTSKDGVYTIPRSSPNNTQPWSFAFSIASAEGVTLDEYDITMSLSLDSSGALTPVLLYTLDGNTLVSTPSGSDLTDNEGVDNQVVQNIERYSFDFLKNILLPTAMRSEPVPYGTYTLAMLAIGKAGGAQEGDKAAVIVRAIVS